MKKFLLKCMGLLVCVICLIGISLFVVPNQYGNVYTSVLLQKYERLIGTKGPKIILVSGSSMAFGINSEHLQKETGMQVVNLGMHAGLGNRFCLEIAKDNIREGDIVIFAPEYWIETDLQAELALISCQDNWRLLCDIPKRDRVNVLRTLPLYCKKKIFMFLTNTGNAPNEVVNEYDPSFFNEYGDATFPRGENPYPVSAVVEEPYVFNPNAISDELCRYVNEVNQYCTLKGATLLISYAPIVENSLTVDENAMNEFAGALDSKLDSSIISVPADYIWPMNKFYGTNFHLNDEGVELRTQQLISDLKNAGY